ncbi:MAG: cation:proton antiporter [Candidatus Methylacidiphilales bacterium]
MDIPTIAQHAVGYLAAAVISVPIAQRLGLGSVLGYLLAGAAIGPFALNVVGGRSGDIMHVAEFGVILTLFIVGLELHPSTLWRLRTSILGLGGLQMICSTAALAAGGLLCGLSLPSAIAAGLILALSSTAIGLQSLKEKGLLGTPGGQASFSVLLFQDLAVIPILAILPLLAMPAETRQLVLDTVQVAHAPTVTAVASAASHDVIKQPFTMMDQLVHMCKLVLVFTVLLGGRFFVRPWFRFIASARLQELFTASALLLVVLTTLLMDLVGLSPALGAFVAGVVLADSEYRHQLEADIEPFKGLLLGLFFIAVGAGIDFALLAANPVTVVGLIVGLVVIKFLVLWGLGYVFKLETSASLLFAFALAQGCEFGFVLLSFSAQHSIFPPEMIKLLILTVALSMAATPLLLMLHEHVIMPCLTPVKPASEREADKVDEHHPVMIAGFGRFGNIAARFLRANGVPATVLDFDPDQIDLLRSIGLKAYFGDASRLDLLRAAGIEQAKMLLVMIDNEAKTLEIVDSVKHHFPHVKIIARARSRDHAYELINRDVPVHHEFLGSALLLASQTLMELGYSEEATNHAMTKFRHMEEKGMKELAKTRHGADYIAVARRYIDATDRAIREGCQADAAEANCLEEKAAALAQMQASGAGSEKAT